MAEITSDLNQLLDEITSNFQENLIRAFRNAAVRNEKKNISRFVHKLDDVLYNVGETKIQLKNLSFPWVPDFRISHLSVNLRMLCLDVSFKLGCLRVEGSYEANNPTLQKILPVSNNGKIVLSFSDVMANGRIGLLIKEDSLVPEHYDMTYRPNETVINVRYHLDEHNEVENKITKSNVEPNLGETVWRQLTEVLTDLLHRQLAEVVVEFSLKELLIDEDDQFRLIAKEHHSRANRIMDSLLCSAKDYIVSQNSHTIPTPAFSISFRGKPSGLEQGWLGTSEGYIKDLTTLTRRQDLSIFEDKQELIVYGTLTLGEFKHGYSKYSAKFEGNETGGTIKASVYRNKIFIKLLVVKEGEDCDTAVDALRVSSVMDIDVDTSGLGALSWLVPRIESWVVGNLRYKALGVLEDYLKEAFNHAIRNTDCVALLAES